MNTIDFVKNIESEDISSIIMNFFDEIMVLYNLVGNKQNIQINTDNDASLASFTLNMETEEDALELFDKLNGSDFDVYDDGFNISMTISKNTIVTVIIRKV